MGPSPQDYKDAIEVQNACNLGAIVHAFDKVITKIQKESHEKALGTNWVTNHPIVTMYVCKLDSMNGASYIAGKFEDAYKECKEKANG